MVHLIKFYKVLINLSWWYSQVTTEDYLSSWTRTRYLKSDASWVIRIIISENWCKCIKMWYYEENRGSISVVVVAHITCSANHTHCQERICGHKSNGSKQWCLLPLHLCANKVIDNLRTHERCRYPLPIRKLDYGTAFYEILQLPGTKCGAIFSAEPLFWRTDRIAIPAFTADTDRNSKRRQLVKFVWSTRTDSINP